MAICKLGGKAGKLDITIEQGATFNPVMTWKDEAGTPIDLSGYTARMDIRQDIADATPVHQATTANAEIVLGGAAGTITFAIPATVTAAFTFTDGAVYDLELESAGGDVTRLLQGSVYLSPEVTR